MHILIVENNEADRRIMEEAFKTACGGRVEPNFVEDGQAVIDFLKKEGPFKNSPSPQLILLDLNLTKKDGRTLLKEIKSDPKFRAIPCLIFSNSQSEADVNECYQLHANAYLLKPAHYSELLSLVKAVYDFWLMTAVYPSPPAPAVV